MILNRPAIDWLTVTTFSENNRIILTRLLEKYTVGVAVKDEKLMQYHGVRGEGFFVGSGEQNGRAHHLFRFSGDLSDTIMFDQQKPPLDCSRIDLQITIPLPCAIKESYSNFSQLTDICQDGIRRGNNRGRKSKVNTILSHDGFCTMYVGHRSSERLYRVYVKENSGKHYLRFEVEYKGKNGLAGRVYREVNKQPEKITGILKAEIDSMPDHLLTLPLKQTIISVEGDFMRYSKVISDPNKTLRWLKHQVSPAFKRLIGNHDTQDAAIMLLADLIDFAKGVEEA